MQDIFTNNKWLKLTLEIAIFIAIFFAVRAWQQRNIVEGVAPNFQSVLLDGKIVSLEDYKGKPLLLHFWADWCPICKIEEASISSINNDWPVLTIAYQSGGKKNIARHMKERNIQDWLTIVDQDGQIAELFGVTVVPTTFILDGNRNIRFSEVGLTSEWGLRFRLWWVNMFGAKTKE